jgi:methionine synthase II (cobalamin-independent)
MSKSMKEQPLRTTVIGSYPFPSWLELASQQLDNFGINEITELQEDAVIVAIHDQVQAGLDVITDGEQSRLDFNLSFLRNVRVQQGFSERFCSIHGTSGAELPVVKKRGTTGFINHLFFVCNCPAMNPDGCL